MSIDIRFLRSNLGVSQVDFSKISGMDQPSIARIETGTKPQTRIHHHLFTAIELLHKHGLINEYLEQLKQDN